MRNIPSEIAEGVMNWLSHEPAANTAATKTASATEGVQHVLKKVWYSYSEAPTGGKLTVETTINGTAVTFNFHIVGTGPGVFEFDIVADANKDLTVTLAAGAGTCAGTLTFCYR